MASGIALTVNGQPVEVPDDGASLLEVLRDRLGLASPKDGCSPQGQCGCCTVLVDGAPRVACVTPARRVAGRSVTTLEGFDAGEQARWSESFCATGASQCGFCTPGIVVRLAALAAAKPTAARAEIDQALLAHLCRCTGWQTIREAFALAVDAAAGASGGARDLIAAARRAELEGGTAQLVAPAVSLGQGGFADDTAPADALVAVLAGDGSWVVGETLAEARTGAGKVQGRRSTVGLSWPVELPPGDWIRTLRTTWVEPGYLEPDSSWCAPGGDPATPLANGGAFGGKLASPLPAVAHELADRHGRVVRVVASREDVVRLGPKRPPLAAGLRADGTGIVRVVRTPGIAAAIASVAPGLEIEEVDVARPPTSAAVRAAGWAEAAVLLASLGDDDLVRAPTGAEARAVVASDGSVVIRLRCGRPLDDVVLRSYCIGAAHMALGFVRSEGLAVDEEATPSISRSGPSASCAPSTPRRSRSPSSRTTASRSTAPTPSSPPWPRRRGAPSATRRRGRRHAPAEEVAPQRGVTSSLACDFRCASAPWWQGKMLRWPGESGDTRGTLEFDRVAFFSDAVFAIAMTLLVVGIAVPKVVAANLGDALRGLEGEILSFFISFVVIGFYWRGHHRFFASLQAVDDAFVTVNLAFLAVVAFVPFPTALIGSYEDEAVAFVLYAVTLTGASLGLVLLNVRATTQNLRAVPRTAVGRRHDRAAQAIPIVVFLVSIPLALLTSTSVALYSWLSIWVFEAVADRVWPADDPPLASVEAHE